MEFILIVLGFLAVCFVFPVFLLRKITRLHRINPKPKIKSRFMMVDLFSLMFLIQLPFSLARFSDARMGELHLLAFGWMFAISLLVWWAALSATNHLGVTSSTKRIVATAFTFPGAVMSGFLSWIAATLLVQGEVVSGWESGPFVLNGSSIFVALIVFLVIGVEWSARWIASGADNNEAALSVD